RLGQRVELGRPLQENEIEGAAERSDHEILAPRFLAPLRARSVFGARPDRNLVALHEALEQRARLVALLLAFMLDRPVYLGGNRQAHLAAEHHGIFRGNGVEADDAAAE